MFYNLLFQALRKEGKGNLPQTSDEFVDEDIDKFYTLNLLGNDNLDSLLRT